MVLVEEKKFRNMIESLQRKGCRLSGHSGSCAINGEVIYKIYNSPRVYSGIHDFSLCSSNSIAFPMEYYGSVSNGNVLGEKMGYIPKKNLYYSLTSNCRIEAFIKNYARIIEEINNFKEIRMNDMVSANILYSEDKGFSLIDTYDWVYMFGCDCSKANIEEFSSNFVDIIVNEYIVDSCMLSHRTVHDFKLLGKYGVLLCRMLELINEESYHIIELIDIFQNLAKENLGYEAKTFADIETCTKKMLKK